MEEAMMAAQFIDAVGPTWEIDISFVVGLVILLVVAVYFLLRKRKGYPCINVGKGAGWVCPTPPAPAGTAGSPKGDPEVAEEEVESP